MSSIGDCYKLFKLDCIERRAVAVIGYEHDPCQIDLTPLVQSFELIAKNVAQINLSPRVEQECSGLCHPVHKKVRLFMWEVLMNKTNN